MLFANFPFYDAFANVHPELVDGGIIRQWENIDTFHPLLTAIPEYLPDAYTRDQAADLCLNFRVHLRCNDVTGFHSQKQAVGLLLAGGDVCCQRRNLLRRYGVRKDQEQQSTCPFVA